jgi:crotonobetaine/carnitine-CoA ligase
MDASVYDRFLDIAGRNGSSPFLAVSAREGREGQEVTFAEIAKEVDAAASSLQNAGYGGGHRIGLLFGNQPRHFVYLLAANSIGASVVPLNPDATPSELAYVIEHAEADLLLAAPAHRTRLEAVAKTCSKQPQVVADLDGDVRPPRKAALTPIGPARHREACLLYTSGTTGRPKGCVATNEYFNFLGRWYIGWGGVGHIRTGQDRIFNPLPVFHQNSGVATFMGALFSANCLVMTDRFHANSWWEETEQCRATVIHYLGVMPAMLLKVPERAVERRHSVRFGVGAGVEPSLHDAFEQRFGIKLVELWGMTETCSGFIDSVEPRQTHTRAFGRPLGRDDRDLEARIVDAEDCDVPSGVQGELLVRRFGGDERRGMFAGYLKDPTATEHVWRGGWFHTGDIVKQSPDGMLYFVDRAKNIIRRSGENIAASEIETVLATHEAVYSVAVLAVPDEIREEEVMACIVLKDSATAADSTVDSILRHCNDVLAYYKAPGWILFTKSLPVTGTQKVQKSSIFPAGFDPRTAPGVLDLRSRKRRSQPSQT